MADDKEPRLEPVDQLPEFYYSKGRNVLIREYVYNYVMKQLSNHGMGHSSLNLSVVEDMTGDIVGDISNLLSFSNLDSLNEAEENQTGYVYNKTNTYNLNIIFSHIKIKVYLGFAARIARENFNIASNHGLNDFTSIIAGCRDRGAYRIEVYKIVQGMTLNDYMTKDRTFAGLWHHRGKVIPDEEADVLREGAVALIDSIDDLLEGVCQYIVNNYYYKWFTVLKNKSDDPENFEFKEDDPVFYPNDNNIGNFVIVYNGENDGYETLHERVYNIDMDQWNSTSVHMMIHNIAIQFIGRMYNRDSYPDEWISDLLKAYRNGDTLFNRINQFKEMFYDKIDKPEWYRPEDMTYYNFWDAGLTMSPAIIRLYLKEMKIVDAEYTDDDLRKLTIASREYNTDFLSDYKKKKVKEPTPVVEETEEGTENE